MEDKYSLQDCGDDDVLCFGNDTFKVGKFRKALNKSFGSSAGSSLTSELRDKGVAINVIPNGNYDDYSNWFTQGIDCEILNLGSKSWKKAKVKIKISIEFYVENEEPEIKQPESPLDDLRQMLNQENQP